MTSATGTIGARASGVGSFLHGSEKRSSMKRPFLKSLFEKIEATFAAAAFAEEGEVGTARRIMAEAGTRARDSQAGRAGSVPGPAPRRRSERLQSIGRMLMTTARTPLRLRPSRWGPRRPRAGP